MTDKQKKICDKYSARGDDGKVRCCECPLRINPGGFYDFRCKANSVYNRKIREWEYVEAEDKLYLSDQDKINKVLCEIRREIIKQFEGTYLYGFSIDDAAYKAHQKDVEIIERYIK